MKCIPTPMDALRRELFIRDLGSVVALSVNRQINFVCVRLRWPIQLYLVLTQTTN